MAVKGKKMKMNIKDEDEADLEGKTSAERRQRVRRHGGHKTGAGQGYIYAQKDQLTSRPVCWDAGDRQPSEGLLCWSS